MSETTSGGIEVLTSDVIETMDKWQQANDARYEALRVAHNQLADDWDRNVNTYNAHIVKHEGESEYARHLGHVINENAQEQRRHGWLIVGAVALAAFALGRSARDDR